MALAQRNAITSPGRALLIFATNGSGAYLTTGGVWTSISDKNKKDHFTPLNGKEVLYKIRQLPVEKWRYTGTNEYHIGPYAQDFKCLFQAGLDDRSISTIDLSGIALIGIQELKKENDELKQKVQQLEQLVNKSLHQ